VVAVLRESSALHHEPRRACSGPAAGWTPRGRRRWCRGEGLGRTTQSAGADGSCRRRASCEDSGQQEPLSGQRTEGLPLARGFA
jgi:hypothetical protein